MKGKEGVVFALMQKGDILLEKRLDPKKQFYNFTIIPGGKIESGEGVWKALEREVMEECNCMPVFSHYISSYFQQEGKILNVRHLFVVSEFEGVVIDKEPEKSKHLWATLNEAKIICRHPSTQEFLNDIEKFTSGEGRYLG